MSDRVKNSRGSGVVAQSAAFVEDPVGEGLRVECFSFLKWPLLANGYQTHNNPFCFFYEQ